MPLCHPFRNFLQHLVCLHSIKRFSAFSLCIILFNGVATCLRELGMCSQRSIYGDRYELHSHSSPIWGSMWVLMEEWYTSLVPISPSWLLLSLSRLVGLKSYQTGCFKVYPTCKRGLLMHSAAVESYLIIHGVIRTANCVSQAS